MVWFHSNGKLKKSEMNDLNENCFTKLKCINDILSSTSKVSISINRCRSGLRSRPHNAKMHYNYANFLKDQEKISLAESYYRNAIRSV